jgi:hypothetical protein
MSQQSSIEEDLDELFEDEEEIMESNFMGIQCEFWKDIDNQTPIKGTIIATMLEFDEYMYLIQFEEGKPMWIKCDVFESITPVDINRDKLKKVE